MANILTTVVGKLKALPQANLPLQSQVQSALNSLENNLAPAAQVGEVAEIMASTVTSLVSTENDYALPSLSGSLPIPTATTYVNRLKQLATDIPQFTMLSGSGRNYCFKFVDLINGAGYEGIGLENEFEDGTHQLVFSLFLDGMAQIRTIIQSVETHTLQDYTKIDSLVLAISRSAPGAVPGNYTIVGLLQSFPEVTGSTLSELVQSLCIITQTPFTTIFNSLQAVRTKLHPAISPRCIHFYELIKKSIQNSRIGQFFKEVLQTILRSQATTFVSNLMSMYTKFKEYEEFLKEHWDNIVQIAMESGMIGVLNYIIDYWLLHRQLTSFDGGYLKLTNNEDFRPESMGLMVLSGIVTVAAQAIGVIMMAFGPVWGAIGFLASTALTIVTAPLHMATQEEHSVVQFDDTHFTSGSPMGYFAAIVPVEGNESIIVSIGDGIGALYPVPGGFIIAGLVDKDHIGLEFHPAFSDPALIPYEGSLSWIEDPVVVGYLTVRSENVRLLTSLVDWNDFIPSSSHTMPVGIYDETQDTRSWMNVRANLAIFLLWIQSGFGAIDLNVVDKDLPFSAAMSISPKTPLWLSCVYQNGIRFYDTEPGWGHWAVSSETLIQAGDDMLRWLYCPIDELVNLKRIMDYGYYGLVIPLTESFGWPLYPPKVQPGSTITAFVVANIIIAAATVTAIVASCAVKRKVRAFQAKKAAAAEASWSDMTKAAAAGDQQAFDDAYKTFRKNAFMNNLSASIFGGTKISPYNYWNQSSTSESTTAADTNSQYKQLLDESLNKREASPDSVDITMEMIYKLICGHMPGVSE